MANHIFDFKKKSMICIMVLVLVMVPRVAMAEPKITAEAAILIDGVTGEILYEKNAFQQRPPASLTKVMTGMLAIELGDLKKTVQVSEKAAHTGGSRLNLITGETIDLENLLYGALLKSGNDACVAIGEEIGRGDEMQFVALMNLKAKLLGCGQTNFMNTNGLPDPNHYSTAYDLSLMARAALQNPIFATIVQTQYHTVQWKNNRQVMIKNTNRLLQFYSGAIGVKTGTTNAAGQCLIAAAERGQRQLIVVVLKSSNRFLDSTILLDYGFSQVMAKAS